MPTNFPASLDTFPSGPTLHGLEQDGSAYTGPPVNAYHSTLHGDLGDAVAALEAKVGINGSLDASSVDYFMAHIAAFLPANIAYKDQANAFTQPQAITGPAASSGSHPALTLTTGSDNAANSGLRINPFSSATSAATNIIFVPGWGVTSAFATMQVSQGAISFASTGATAFETVGLTTNVVIAVGQFQRNVQTASGLAGDGIGMSFQWICETNFGGASRRNRTLIQMQGTWTTADDSTRIGRMDFLIGGYLGLQTCFSLASNGGVAQLAFFGADPVPQQNGVSAIVALRNYNLLVNGSGTTGNLFITPDEIFGNNVAGQVIVDQGGGLGFAAETMSGDATIATNGVVTVSKSGGVAFGSAAFAATSAFDVAGAAAAALATAEGYTTSSLAAFTGTANIVTVGTLTAGATGAGFTVALSTSTVTGTLGVTHGGTGTATAFTAGSVVFAGASGVYSQDNAQLFWDDTAHTLRVGASGGGCLIGPTYLKMFGSVTDSYVYFTNDDSIGGSFRWGSTSGAGVSFASTSFIPTSPGAMSLGGSTYLWNGVFGYFLYAPTPTNETIRNSLFTSAGWNNGGITFPTHWLAQVTNTASAAGTLLLDMQVGGVSAFKVGKLGDVTHALADAATNAVSTLATLAHNTSGTAAAGFGSALVWSLQSSTTPQQLAAEDQSLWATATHASRKGRRTIGAHDFNTSAGSPREGFRVESDGTQPLTSVNGVAAVARQLLATGAGHTVDDVITALQAFGILKQS